MKWISVESYYFVGELLGQNNMYDLPISTTLDSNIYISLCFTELYIKTGREYVNTNVICGSSFVNKYINVLLQMIRWQLYIEIYLKRKSYTLQLGHH